MQASTLQVSVDRHAAEPKSLAYFNRVCPWHSHQLLQLRYLLRSQLVPTPANPTFRPGDTQASMDECAATRSFEGIQTFDDVNQGRGIERAGGLPFAEFQLNSSINQVAERDHQLFEGKCQLFEARNHQPVATAQGPQAGEPLRGRPDAGRTVLDIDLGATGAYHGLPLSHQIGRTFDRTRVADFTSHDRNQRLNRWSLPEVHPGLDEVPGSTTNLYM